MSSPARRLPMWLTPGAMSSPARSRPGVADARCDSGSARSGMPVGSVSGGPGGCSYLRDSREQARTFEEPCADAGGRWRNAVTEAA